MKNDNTISSPFETCPVQPKQQNQSLHKRMRFNVQRKTISNQLQTLQQSTKIGSKQLKFKILQTEHLSGTPGVGCYQISSPIARPAYETYEKNNQVILVKINHIGGTSSFRGEDQRQSIYQETPTPGPGSYETITQKNRKVITGSYSENYDIIQKILRHNREVIQSIPNYKIQSKVQMEYNGIPSHLQKMYNQLDKSKQSPVIKAMPLEKLIKLRKKAEIRPLNGRMTESSLDSTSLQNRHKSNNRYRTSAKMTQTMYKLDEESKRQSQRQQKIKALLENSNKKRCVSMGKTYISSQKKQKQLEMKMKMPIFNKNMINILYQKMVR